MLNKLDERDIPVPVKKEDYWRYADYRINGKHFLYFIGTDYKKYFGEVPNELYNRAFIYDSFVNNFGNVILKDGCTEENFIKEFIIKGLQNSRVVLE